MFIMSSPLKNMVRPRHVKHMKITANTATEAISKRLTDFALASANLTISPGADCRMLLATWRPTSRNRHSDWPWSVIGHAEL